MTHDSLIFQFLRNLYLDISWAPEQNKCLGWVSQSRPSSTVYLHKPLTLKVGTDVVLSPQINEEVES